MNSTIAGISSMATRQLLADLVAEWRSHGGAPVFIESTGGVDAARRVEQGEQFDLVVLAADALERLVAKGLLDSTTSVAIVDSSVAIAVRRGAARPCIDNEAALREAVLAAPSIGFSTGPSGVALQALFDRWEISSAIARRVVTAPPGVPVGKLIAAGEVALGFQQLSELMGMDGVDVVGTLPGDLEIVTTFSGAVSASSARRAATVDFLDFARSSATAAIKHRNGMRPCAR